jgi:hypothetical protein
LPPREPTARSASLPSASSLAGALSYAQERLWFLDQLTPGNPAYNLRRAFRLRGPLNLAALEHSLSALAARHDLLRAALPDVAGQPRLTILIRTRTGRY